jgi:hypothetical protein
MTETPDPARRSGRSTVRQPRLMTVFGPVGQALRISGAQWVRTESLPIHDFRLTSRDPQSLDFRSRTATEIMGRGSSAGTPVAA